jgi:hypothetical protein
VTLLKVAEGTLSALAKEKRPMAYKIARIDVHKMMLAVVVSEVEIDGEYEFERRTGSRFARSTLTPAPCQECCT